MTFLKLVIKKYLRAIYGRSVVTKVWLLTVYSATKKRF